MTRQQLGHEAHTTDVLVPILTRVPKIACEMGANDVSVERFDGEAAGPEPTFEGTGDGRLARRGQTGEPDSDAGLQACRPRRGVIGPASRADSHVMR